MPFDSYRQRPAKCPKPYLRNHRRRERGSAFTYPLWRWCMRCGKTATAYPLRRPTESPPKTPSLRCPREVSLTGGGERARDRNEEARRGLLCRRLGHGRGRGRARRGQSSAARNTARAKTERKRRAGEIFLSLFF
jgi:hypothetical protein